MKHQRGLCFVQQWSTEVVWDFDYISEAIACVVSSMYGDLRTIGAGIALLIIAQLFIAGLIVLTLDLDVESFCNF